MRIVLRIFIVLLVAFFSLFIAFLYVSKYSEIAEGLIVVIATGIAYFLTRPRRPRVDTYNACDRAIERERAALQAFADRIGGDPKAPVNASFILTGSPSLAELEAELEAARAEVETACKGASPTV